MNNITTVEIEKELHLKVRDLADNSGMKVKKLVAYLLEEGMKEFRKKYAGLMKGEVKTTGI